MMRSCLVALCGAVWLTSAHGQTPEARKATVGYVRSLQTSSGGFLPARPAPTSSQLARPTLRATSSALRALRYLGAELPNQEACARFVASCFDQASGGFSDLPGGKPDVFTTA